VDEKINRNNQGSGRSDPEQHSQPDHSIASVGRKAMGATPKTTVGWGAVVACLGALLALSSQIDSKIDDRIDKKIDPVKATYDEKFRTTGRDIDEIKRDQQNLRDEIKSWRKK